MKDANQKEKKSECSNKRKVLEALKMSEQYNPSTYEIHGVENLNTGN